jgi:hypothetical protein
VIYNRRVFKNNKPRWKLLIVSNIKYLIGVILFILSVPALSSCNSGVLEVNGVCYKELGCDYGSYVVTMAHIML